MTGSSTARVTVRVDDSYIQALDALADAGEFTTRSAALRVAVARLVATEARWLPTSTDRPRRRHLPGDEGNSLCGHVADCRAIGRQAARHIALCERCLPAVDDGPPTIPGEVAVNVDD